MKLEDSLNGGFAGLYGEVVTADCYRLQTLQFRPDTIFDIGANVGIFARHARSFFPYAKIISLEPDPSNCAVFREFTRDSRTLLIEKALGHGQIYHGTTARNGSGEVYLSAGLGYPAEKMESAVGLAAGLEKSSVKSITFSDLVIKYAQGVCILKLDCEGAENTIWTDQKALTLFRSMEYIAAEIHFYAQDGQELPAVRERTMEVINLLRETHHVELENVHLWATRRR